MPEPDAAVLRWAVEHAAAGADVVEVRGLRGGGSPWLVRLDRAGTRHDVILRVGPDPSPLRTEAAALEFAAAHGLPVPRLLAAEFDGEPLLPDRSRRPGPARLPSGGAVLSERLAGSSAIPGDPSTARLRALGGAAAALHRVPLEPGPALPHRDRPIPGEDFAALRREQPRPLLLEAEKRLADQPVPYGDVFVHGDLWQGNALWDGDTLVGLIDWDCAGSGHPGVDLGSLRCDAALCFGPGAADHVLRGWQDATGRAAGHVAYWDVVAALCTPPDLGWFVGAISGQGRPDLTQPVLLDRRDAFLRAALDRLDAGS